MTTYVLCGKPNRCCPTVDENGDRVTIRDDYGGKVVLTKKQYEILKTGKGIKKEE